MAPEVRMTEAARKRSAKIRQDKESAENKGPASPRLRTPIKRRIDICIQVNYIST